MHFQLKSNWEGKLVIFRKTVIQNLKKSIKEQK